MWILIAVVIVGYFISKVVIGFHRNNLQAQTAERLIGYLARDASQINYWVAKIMNDEELATAMLNDKMVLSSRGSAIELIAFPVVTANERTGFIEQGNKVYEIRAEGQELLIIERGARGSVRETRLNVNAVLRVLAAQHVIKEKRNGKKVRAPKQ